jgi:hypothetical protein
MAMSLPRRRLGGVDRRGGGDTIRRVDDGANCCGEDADGHGGDDANCCGEDPDGHGGNDADCSGEDPDGHGGDDANCCGEDPDGHGGNDADSSGEDPDGHGGDDADGHGCEATDGHGCAGVECHAGGVGCDGGGANVGGEKVGCSGGEDTPSHGAVGCQPRSGSGDGKSAVGHCSAVTSVPQETQNRADSSGRGCPHDGHQRATVPPKSAPPGRFHAVPGPAPLPVSPATEVPLPSRRQVITRLQSGTRLSRAGIERRAGWPVAHSQSSPSFPPRHQHLQQAAQNMLVRLWPAHCRTSTEGRQAGRDCRGQDGRTETPHKLQNLRTGGLS